MQIHENGHNIIDYYFGYLLKQSQRRTIHIGVQTGKRDVLVISDSTKRKLTNAYIEAAENSGEPLVGISYDDYSRYYWDKCGLGVSEKTYRQALKGDNASLREREWRYNPDYKIPIRIYDSPEVTEDRNAAIEKYSRGEELADWEKTVMYTFRNGGEMLRVTGQAKTERTRNITQGKISAALADIGLPEGTELNFEVWGKEITVTGNIDGSTLDAVREALDGIDGGSVGYRLRDIWEGTHDDYNWKKVGIARVELQNAENVLTDDGSGVTVFDLGVDEDGNITGLPENVENFINEYAVGRSGDKVPEEYAEHRSDVLKARAWRDDFKSAVRTVQSGDYDRFRSMTCKLTYKDGVLSC